MLNEHVIYSCILYILYCASNFWSRNATKYRPLQVNSFFNTLKGKFYKKIFCSWLLCWELFTDKNWNMEWCISKDYAKLRSWRLCYLPNANQSESRSSTGKQSTFFSVNTQKIWVEESECCSDICRTNRLFGSCEDAHKSVLSHP